MQTDAEDRVYERLRKHMGIPEGKPLDVTKALQLVVREGHDTEALGCLMRGMLLVLIDVREKNIRKYRREIRSYRKELHELEQAAEDREIAFDGLFERFLGPEWKAVANG